MSGPYSRQGRIMLTGLVALLAFGAVWWIVQGLVSIARGMGWL